MQNVIVVDSNYFISKLEFIKTLLSLLDTLSTIIVPFAVVQELDGLKQSPTVGIHARNATNFLLSQIHQNPHILGQRQDQVIQIQTIMDDKILDCCLFFKTLGSTVYLLSNDKNLRLKAVIHNIQTPIDITPLQLVYAFKHEVEMDIDSDHEQHTASIDILVDMHQILQSINTLILDHILPAFYNLVQVYYGDMCAIRQPQDLYELVVMMQDEYEKSIPSSCFVNPYFKFHQLKIIAKDIVRSLRQDKCIFTRGDLKWFCRDFRECFLVLDVVGGHKSFVEGIMDDLFKMLDC
jgi:rRNA-processing protein FCF1